MAEGIKVADNPVPVGSKVSVGEYKIHYLSYGAGPAVVFLHGSGPGASGYSNFKQNISAVVESGRQAIVLDMLGFGYSSKPTDCDYTTDLFASTVVGALGAIGIDRCVLVGNSLGGAVSIRIALDNPLLVTALVLMAPGGIEEAEVYYAMPGISRMVSQFVGGELDRDRMRALLQMLVRDPGHVTDALVNERFSILQEQPKEVLSRLVVPNMANELGSLTCPIIGFWGQKDQFTPVSGFTRFMDVCEDCRFTIVANCGHWVMVERMEMFNAQLKHFLSSQSENALTSGGDSSG